MPESDNGPPHLYPQPLFPLGAIQPRPSADERAAAPASELEQCCLARAGPRRLLVQTWDSSRGQPAANVNGQNSKCASPKPQKSLPGESSPGSMSRGSAGIEIYTHPGGGEGTCHPPPLPRELPSPYSPTGLSHSHGTYEDGKLPSPDACTGLPSFWVQRGAARTNP